MSDANELRDLADRARRARREWEKSYATLDLVTLADLAERWGIARTTITEHADRDDFPEPVATFGRSWVWLGAEVELWRATPRPAGRPPLRAK